MASGRYGISVRVMKNVPRARAANEYNIFQYEKRNLLSPTGHAMFYLLYINTNEIQNHVLFSHSRYCVFGQQLKWFVIGVDITM